MQAGLVDQFQILVNPVASGRRHIPVQRPAQESRAYLDGDAEVQVRSDFADVPARRQISESRRMRPLGRLAGTMGLSLSIARPVARILLANSKGRSGATRIRANDAWRTVRRGHPQAH